jgi:transcriptional regulator with XRE-family HTH domain
MTAILSPQELETSLGNGLRNLRLQKNLDQVSLAERAGVSLTALKNLEAGQATLKTLVRVTRALGRQDWLMSLSPPVSINPLHMVRNSPTRQRAGRRTKGYREESSKKEKI